MSYLIFFFVRFCSNGGSDKQHLDSSDESDLDTPNMMHNTNNSTNTSQQQSAQQQQLQLQLGLSGGNSGNSSHHHLQHHHHAQHGNSNTDNDGNPDDMLSLSHVNNSGSGGGGNGSGHPLTSLASQGKMPSLSAAAYSHLHSVIGAGTMPLYDIPDYQHL